MDMVEQPRADWHSCLGLLIERRAIAGLTGSKERTVELSAMGISADPISSRKTRQRVQEPHG
jgi:hypothetical protein